MLLKKLYKILFVVLIIIIFTSQRDKYIEYEENIDDIVNSNRKLKYYNGYLYIPKFDYRRLIKSGNSNEILDSNNILLLNNGSNIESNYGNVVLAGHNNKYVFSILYKLEIGDELSVFSNNKIYKYKIYNIKVIDIEETYVLDNIYTDKILTLITCTKNNQKRLVVLSKLCSP